MHCIWNEHEGGVICINCGRLKARPTRRNCKVKKGLGDTIANVTKAIGLKPCGGCNKRRSKVNNLAPTSAYKHARYITTAELATAALNLAAKIPADVKGVVGIPRSGMIPASVLAAQLHVPLFSYANGHVVHCGHGNRFTEKVSALGRLVFVDDTLMMGTTLKHHRPESPHLWAVVYQNPHAKISADIFGQELEPPHLLEWNLFNSQFCNDLATDLDGVLCHDMPRDADLTDARPLHLPRRTAVKAIITARCERWRMVTKAWLSHYGVKYEKLIMGQWKTEAERDSNPAQIAQYKADAITRLGVNWFTESCPRQAEDIAALSGVWTICPTNSKVF